MKVEAALYADASRRRWFVGRPDRIRTRWTAVGWVLLLASAAIAFVLIRWSKVALLGLPLVLGAILVLIGARWMPRRTARGTALTRRVLGFRRAIETAEGNLSRWAEQANVFTKYLPYAIVFGCTEKWAKAFEGLAEPPDTSWYVSGRPFAYTAFADQMDGFSVRRAGRSRRRRRARAAAGSAAGGSAVAAEGEAAAAPGDDRVARGRARARPYDGWMFLRENEEGRRIAPHLEAGQSVLDLGAGTGFMARWLRDHTGVRPTLSDLVDYSNRDRDLDFIHQRDPGRVPVDDGSFDVVLLMFVLHHIPAAEDQERLLDEAVRIARQRVVIAEDTPVSRLDRAFNMAWDWLLNLRHGVPTPFTFRPVEAWQESFKERDLSIAHVETYRPLWPTLGTYRHTLFVLDR